MSQSKSKSSSKKQAKKPATSKKVKRTAAAAAPVELVPTPAPIFPDEPQVTLESKPAAADLQLPVVAAPARLVTRAEFLELVRKEAYRRATHRNFKNGSPFQDWVHAEAAVSGKLAAEGARLS